MGSIRPPAVAGLFYPRDVRALGAQVDALLEETRHLAPRIGSPKALIVPHAGYMYSGRIAARAYGELDAARGRVRRVVMLGPAHRVPVRGLAISSATAFATPLGEVPLDQGALAAVHGLPQVVVSDAAHALEHSLEVQLPFLQAVLEEFHVVPFAVGNCSVAEVAQVVERLWGGPETLVILSTDLSHYHAYDEARRIDSATVARIGAFAVDLAHEEACGATPLNGLLAVAKAKRLSMRFLAACNSGDTGGDRQQVVGYGAFALDEGEAVCAEDAGKALVSIARGSIEGALFGTDAAVGTADGWLAQPGATFVTLMRAGSLRGCIGSLAAVRALADDVAENARAAAFRDPRFPALSGREWPDVKVEVSLLSPPKRVRFAEEEDLLAQVRAGEDGLILEARGQRGTFLPQVWESFPDKRAFLAALFKKSGLPADTKLAECSVSRYRVMKWTQ